MKVHLFNDPMDKSRFQEFDYSCPAEFLMRHYGARHPEGKNILICHGEPSLETTIPLGPQDPGSEKALLCEDYDYITVLESPGDPWTIGAVVVALVAAEWF